MIKKDNLHNYLIIALLFTITIKTSISFLIAFFILLLWIREGEFKKRFKIIFTDKLSITFMLFFAIHLVGLLWTEDLHNGLKILSKQKTYLFAPIIISFFDRRYVKYALFAFLSAIFISEIYSIYLYIKVGVQDAGRLPSPFMHHMHYSLILAFTFGYLIDETDFKELFKKRNLLYLAFAILTLIVLFINKGRIGQVAIVPVFFILAVNKFNISFIKSIFVVSLASTILFLVMYQFNDQFKYRFQKADHELTEILHTDKRDSITCRFDMWNYAIKLANTEPAIGIGTGDSIDEINNLLGEDGYKKLFAECGLGMKYQFNPHNNFVLYYMQFGFIGLILLILTLTAQIMIAYRQNSTKMMILIFVTIIGMMSASPISMHIKYMFFYAFVLSMLYLDSQKESSTS
jgi:O-antigen ligase